MQGLNIITIKKNLNKCTLNLFFKYSVYLYIMDQEEFLLSLSILTDKTKLLQSDINKIQDDVFNIQGGGELSKLKDVHDEVPTDGQILIYNGTDNRWEPQLPPDAGGTKIVGTSLRSLNTECNVNSTDAISLGHYAGKTGHSQRAIAIGAYAGQNSQNEGNIAIGAYAQQNTGSGQFSIGIGYYAGYEGQAGNAVAIGTNAAVINQKNGCIAIGYASGRLYQEERATAIGHLAGSENQQTCTAAFGAGAGLKNQGARATAIGASAGENYQGEYSTAIGYSAGFNNLSPYSVAIGYEASSNTPSDVNNFILLNASGQAFQPTSSNGFHVKPIRNSTSANKLLYDETTGEITYQPDSGSMPKFDFFNAKVNHGDSISIEPTGTLITNWTILESTMDVILSNGSAFVASADATYNVKLSLAIVNSQLASTDKYILYISNGKPALQTYDFTTSIYNDAALLDQVDTTIIPLYDTSSGPPAVLEVAPNGDIPSSAFVEDDGILGNSTSYISLNDSDFTGNSYFSLINDMQDFSIEINFKPSTTGNPCYFSLLSSGGRAEVVLEDLDLDDSSGSGFENVLQVLWRGSMTDSGWGGYALIEIQDRTSFQHLMLVFNKSVGVTIYLNGEYYSPTQGGSQGALVLNTIQSIQLGGLMQNGYAGGADRSGDERFRSFSFYKTSVSENEASKLYMHRHARRSVHEFTPDGNTTYVINHEEQFSLAKDDEMYILLGGGASHYPANMPSYNLSSVGLQPDEPSLITVKRNVIDNQNYPEYFLTVDNTKQVVWAEAPRVPVYYEASAILGQIKEIEILSGENAPYRAATGKITFSGQAEYDGEDQVFEVTLLLDPNTTNEAQPIVAEDINIINSGKNFTVNELITVPGSVFEWTDPYAELDLVLKVTKVTTDIKIKPYTNPGFHPFEEWETPDSSRVPFIAPRDGRYLVNMQTAINDSSQNRGLQIIQKISKSITLQQNSVYDENVASVLVGADFSFDFRKAKLLPTDEYVEASLPTPFCFYDFAYCQAEVASYLDGTAYSGAGWPKRLDPDGGPAWFTKVIGDAWVWPSSAYTNTQLRRNRRVPYYINNGDSWTLDNDFKMTRPRLNHLGWDGRGQMLGNSNDQNIIRFSRFQMFRTEHRIAGQLTFEFYVKMGIARPRDTTDVSGRQILLRIRDGDADPGTEANDLFQISYSNSNKYTTYRYRHAFGGHSTHSLSGHLSEDFVHLVIVYQKDSEETHGKLKIYKDGEYLQDVFVTWGFNISNEAKYISLGGDREAGVGPEGTRIVAYYTEALTSQNVKEIYNNRVGNYKLTFTDPIQNNVEQGSNGNVTVVCLPYTPKTEISSFDGVNGLKHTTKTHKLKFLPDEISLLDDGLVTAFTLEFYYKMDSGWSTGWVQNMTNEGGGHDYRTAVVVFSASDNPLKGDGSQTSHPTLTEGTGEPFPTFLNESVEGAWEPLPGVTLALIHKAEVVFNSSNQAEYITVSTVLRAVNHSTGLDEEIWNAPNFWTENVFDHVAITYDGSKIITYRNGVLFNQYSIVLSPNKPNYVEMSYVDYGADYENYPDDSEMRFFRYYKNRALTEENVTDLYNAYINSIAYQELHKYNTFRGAIPYVPGTEGDVTTTFQFDKILNLQKDDTLKIYQQTFNRDSSGNLSDDNLSFVPEETMLVVRSID